MIESNIKKTYFKIDDNNVIYPSTLGKRVLAKILDFLFATIVGVLLVGIFNIVNYSNGNSFQTRTPHDYDVVFMIGSSISIIGILIFFFVIPFLNKKNPGQSLGKKILSITPLYLDDKNFRIKILLRELPISLFFVFYFVLNLIIGINYYEYFISFTRNINSKEFENYSFPYYQLLLNWNHIMKNTSITGYNIETYQIVFILIQDILYKWIFTVLILFLLINISMDWQRRGFHDKLANTSIVDLKLIISEEEAIKRYEKILNINNNVDNNFSSDVEDYSNDLVELSESESEVLEGTNIINEEFNNSIELEEINNDVEENEQLDIENNSDNFEVVDNEDNFNSEKENEEEIDQNKQFNYEKLTVVQIKSILDEKNIKYNSKMKKSDLIELLKNNK